MRILRASKEEYEDSFDINAIEDALRLMGFAYLEMNFFRRQDPEADLVMYAELFDDAVILDAYEKNQKIDSITTSEPEEIITFVEKILGDHDIENIKIIEADELEALDCGIHPRSVMAAKHKKKRGKRKHGSRGRSQTPPAQSYTSAPSTSGGSNKRQRTSTRDFADKLSRVRSSNVWAYAFNPKDEYVGDMLMQFKGTNGGPGDIYIYYDVPTKIWRRLVASPSKGHAFWKLIRNNYTYAKLTGDKRTKLPNGI